MSESMWRNRPVFVTGATGFLGGWLVKALADRGATVVALVRDQVPRSMFMREGLRERSVVVQGSVEDFPILRRALGEYEVKTVFHLAAQSIVPTAKNDPAGTLEVNVRGTWNVLEACRQAGVEQVIVASSDKAYGAHDQLPYLETHALQGRFPYDASKSCADLITRMYADAYHLPTGIARCANLFGGGDLNDSRLIPGLIRSTLEGRRFVIRSDGKFVRDYLYIEDAAEAYLLMAEKLAANPGLAGEAFNFSIETRIEVLGLVLTLLETMGRSDLEPVIENRASNEIREQYLSAEKAKRLLGWRAAYDLEDGLRRTIAWYRNFFSQTGEIPEGGEKLYAAAAPIPGRREG